MEASAHLTAHAHHDHHAPLPTAVLIGELVSDEESARHTTRVQLAPTTHGAGA